MKILMTAHTRDEHGLHFPGDIIELGDEDAIDYLKRGLALPYKEPVERAVVEKVEHATGPAQRSYQPPHVAHETPKSDKSEKPVQHQTVGVAHETKSDKSEKSEKKDESK